MCDDGWMYSWFYMYIFVFYVLCILLCYSCIYAQICVFCDSSDLEPLSDNKAEVKFLKVMHSFSTYLILAT